MALDAGTGKRKWYFQFTPRDIFDWDATEIPVLVLTTFDDDANLFGALRAGAGYLLKDVSSETLVSAIHAATRGESFLQST